MVSNKHQKSFDKCVRIKREFEEMVDKVYYQNGFKQTHRERVWLHSREETLYKIVAWQWGGASRLNGTKSP